MAYPNYAASDFSTYAPETRRSGLASASRILGYIGLLAWLLPIVGLPITVIGLALGIASLKGVETGKAVRASLLCTVGLLLTIGNSIAGIYLYTHGKFPTLPQQASPQQIVNPHCVSPPPTTGP